MKRQMRSRKEIMGVEMMSLPILAEILLDIRDLLAQTPI